MTSQQPARQIGLNKRPGGMFGLQSAPAAEPVESAPANEPPQPAAVPAAVPAPTPPSAAKIRSIAPPAPATQPEEELAVVRIGLYLKPSVADAAQNTMAAFGSQNAAAIRQRGARRNSLNAFLAAVLDHALEHFDEVDPAEIVRRMPTAGPKR